MYFSVGQVSVTLASDTEQNDPHDLLDANRDQNFIKSIEKTVGR